MPIDYVVMAIGAKTEQESLEKRKYRTYTEKLCKNK